MALKAKVFKAELAIADMDRHYYHTHKLTLAQHPSENDARMMVRLLAFALNADEALEFTRGLCVDEEPELWQRSIDDTIERWIELGQPDEKHLRKACHRANAVTVYCYQGASSEVWWKQQHNKLALHNNLQVMNISPASVEQLALLSQRSMRLQCTIQDGQVWLGDDTMSVTVELQSWQDN